MMRLLLHGPAKQISRRKLTDIKGRFDPNNVVVFEEGTDLRTIKTALASQSLFADQQLIILENPLDIPSDSFDSSDSLTLIIWFDREVDPKNFGGFEISFFPEAKEISVFPFLDLLATKDYKAYIEMEKLKRGGFDIHYFLTMVFYLLRTLVVTPKNVPHFVRDKLQRQRRSFPPEKVKNLYKQVLEIEFKIKLGLMEENQAEFLLVQSLLRA